MVDYDKWTAEVDKMIAEFRVQIAANSDPDHPLQLTVTCRYCGIALRLPAAEIEDARTGLLAHPPLCPVLTRVPSVPK